MSDEAKQRIVMVVEDDRDVRDTLAEVLTDHDYVPLCAENGRQALDELRLSSDKPCVILLDLMMPVMDGWQFRAAQKADPLLQDIPVVVLSAHADVDSFAPQLQADCFLKKPVALQVLLSTVEKLCNGCGGPTAAAPGR